MAKTKISEFDSTPANNTDIDSINIAEGCAPSGINNAIRELMSQLKDQQTGASADNFTVGGNLAVTGTTTFTGAVVMSTALPVASGGTGASTAGNARTNLSAASSGANSDITSITGLTTALTVPQGGTGAATLTANNVLLGNGTSAIQTIAPSTNGNVLTSNGTTWTSAAPAASGVTSAVAGNGMAVSGATGAVTFSFACPTWGSVGSYANGVGTSTGSTNGSGGWNDPTALTVNTNYSAANAGISGGSGTWKCMGQSGAYYSYFDVSISCTTYRGIGASQSVYLFCRVS